MPYVPAPWVNRGKRSLGLLAIVLVGCASPATRRASDVVRALDPPPTTPEAPLRSDQAVVAAFFAGHGIHPTPEEIEGIIPPASLPGHMDRNAFRQTARRHRRILLPVVADEPFLWRELTRQRPLLLMLPPDTPDLATATPMIPIAMDRQRQTIDLLDGHDRIHTLDIADFFTRRQPLNQLALSLARPADYRRMQPTPQQQALLADFWFHQGFYRHAQNAYGRPTPPYSLDDVEALIGHANIHVQRRRHRRAIALFQAALELDPSNPRILNNLAYTMREAGVELDLAARYARQALEQAPQNPIYLETLAGIHLIQQDPATAARLLEQAWATSTAHSPGVQTAILDQLVRAWLANDRRDLAIQVAQHRNRTFPNQAYPRDLRRILPELISP